MQHRITTAGAMHQGELSCRGEFVPVVGDGPLIAAQG